jgi:DNA-directed RNA polymerase specialized sigma24 family protein
MAEPQFKPDDVTHWLRELRSPDPAHRAAASQKLFNRYVELLQREVRSRLGSKLRAEVDSNLVAAKALQSFLGCATSSVTNGNSLFNWLLNAVAWRSTDAIRAATAKCRYRGGKVSLDEARDEEQGDDAIGALDQGYVVLPLSDPEIKRRQEHNSAHFVHHEKGDSAFASMEDARLVLLEVDPGAAAFLIELVDSLPPQYQEIAALAISGNTPAEIARELSYSVRAIQHSLRDMRKHLEGIVLGAPSRERSEGDSRESGKGE